MAKARRSPIISYYAETLEGVISVRAFGLGSEFVSRYESLRDAREVVEQPLTMARKWLNLRLDLIHQALISSQTIFLIYSKESLTPAMAGLALFYGRQIINTIQSMARNKTNLENDIVAVERVQEYSDLKEEAKAFTNDALVLSKIGTNFPSHGKIEFENYSTGYVKSSSQTENVNEATERFLKNLNLKIDPGEKVGIVGRTGAGKSSLTLALFRILEPITGKIFIDGVDITDIGLIDLRKSLTIIPQDPLLFSGSLRYNLDPTSTTEVEITDETLPRYSDERYWQVLEAANLKDFIASKTDKLDFQIEENGANVSVGQRQLICLARALLRKSKILVLDEATAAVDPKTDQILQETIRREFSECTVLTIAHRLNTIIDYDKILVLDEGKLVEVGSPQKLLADGSSRFFSMCRAAGLV